MDIANTFSQFNFTPEVLLVVILINLVIVGGLLFLVLRQKKQINTLQTAAKPKYGFLGKPLYSMFTVALLAGGFGIAYVANDSLVDDVIVRADIDLQIEIKHNVLADLGDKVQVQFQMLPTINGVQWGMLEGNAELDVFWNISGVESLSRFELGLSKQKPSSIVVVLQKGVYTVQVDVLTSDRSWKHNQVVNF